LIHAHARSEAVGQGPEVGRRRSGCRRSGWAGAGSAAIIWSS